MHGLMGGSWKRSGYQVMATEKNNPRETVRCQRLRDLPPDDATAPALDPPSGTGIPWHASPRSAITRWNGWRCSWGSDINAGVAMVCPWSPTFRRTGAGWSTCREPWSHPGQVPRLGGKS